MAASMIIKRYLLRAAGFALAGCGWLIIGPCIPKHQTHPVYSIAVADTGNKPDLRLHRCRTRPNAAAVGW